MISRVHPILQGVLSTVIMNQKNMEQGAEKKIVKNYCIVGDYLSLNGINRYFCYE